MFGWFAIDAPQRGLLSATCDVQIEALKASLLPRECYQKKSDNLHINSSQRMSQVLNAADWGLNALMP